MPGRLGRNLRKGHLAEELGILFLKQFCAVSEIKQEEDIGIDAVATLLREEDGLLYAENTFSVQIKSESVNQIIYSDNEIQWFINQDLPFFICTVNIRTQRVAFYTTNLAYQIIYEPKINEVKIIFDGESCFEKSFELEDKSATVKLGPPIFSLTLGDLNDDENKTLVYELLKAWVEIENQLIILRKHGTTDTYKWKEWENPVAFGKIVKGSYLNFERDLNLVKPYLEYFSNHFNNSFELRNHPAIEALKIFEKLYEENGIEIDLNIPAEKHLT